MAEKYEVWSYQTLWKRQRVDTVCHTTAESHRNNS